MRSVPAIPAGGKVRIQRDTASPLHVLRCALPCGGARGCALPDAVCWLGSAPTAERAAAYAARLGLRVAA